MDGDHRSILRVIKSTILNVQNPVIRARYVELVRTNKDGGRNVEWSAPVPRTIVGRTIEAYERDFGAETIGTDERLDEISASILKSEFQTTDAGPLELVDASVCASPPVAAIPGE